MTPARRSSARGELPGRTRTAVDRVFQALGDARARPNLPWLAFLSGAPVERLAPFLAELEELVPFAAEIRRRHVEAGRPGYAQFRAPFELYVLVRHLRPEHIIETGVSSGFSSAHFLLALRRNGRGQLHSIDLPLHQTGPEFGPPRLSRRAPPGPVDGLGGSRGTEVRLGPSDRPE